MLDVEVSSSFIELHVSFLLDDAALPGRDGAELRAYLSLFTSLVCETDIGDENYRSVVARLDDELVSCSASFGCGSELLQASKQACQFTLKLSAEPEKAADLVAWADKLVHECEFPEEKVLSTCRRMITGLKESMRDGDSVLSQVMTAAVHSPTSPQLQFGALAQRPFLERCAGDIASTCKHLRRLRDIITAPTTASFATVSGNTADSRGITMEMVQKAWRARHSVLRPSLLEAVKWTAGTAEKRPALLPFRHLVVGCAGADTATVHLRADLPLPPLALDGKKSWALRLLCEALSMMEGPLSMVVRGKGLAYGASVGFSASENAVTLDLYECTNVRKSLEGVLGVLRDAIEDDLLNPFQLDNARGSLVFQLKGKRATPTSVVGAAVDSASRGWRSAAEVLDWENILGSVTQDDVFAALTESLAGLCDASQVIACVVCDPSDCKKMAKGLAAGLGLDAKKVFVQENLTDCYDLVDGRIRAALTQIPA